MNVGTLEPVPIREVWPREDADFTPWLESHLEELEKALGLGLADARREVGAGDFRIDLVAATDKGEVVIENQYKCSDHKHLGQLLTYLAHREVRRAIWIVEEAHPAHVKAVEVLNRRGVGEIWMVTVQAVRIGDSDAAPLFTVVAEPSDVESQDEEVPPPSRPGQPVSTTRADLLHRFLKALLDQARKEGGEDWRHWPFQGRAPNESGTLDVSAQVREMVYRAAVNQKESRVVLANRRGKCLEALDVLLGSRSEIDDSFAKAGLPRPLEWSPRATRGSWAIRYKVDVGYLDEEPDVTKLRELVRAAAAMKRIFDPCLRVLSAQADERTGVAGTGRGSTARCAG